MTISLRVTDAGGRTFTVAIEAADLTIGRRRDKNTLALPSLLVSRQHARVVLHDDGTLTIADLGSVSGTFVNGKRVTRRCLLTEDDVIDLGPFQINVSGRALPGALPGGTVPAWVGDAGDDEAAVTIASMATPSVKPEDVAVGQRESVEIPTHVPAPTRTAPDGVGRTVVDDETAIGVPPSIRK